MVRKLDFRDLKAAGDYLVTQAEDAIIVCLPDRPLVPVSIPISRLPEPKRWHFTGTPDCPSLTPSIQILAPGNWHGYITNGNLV